MTLLDKINLFLAGANFPFVLIATSGWLRVLSIFVTTLCLYVGLDGR